MSAPELHPIVRAPSKAEAAAQPYDFARPVSFSDRQMRTVAEAQTALAEGLAVALGDALGEPVVARCEGVAEVEAQDFERSRTRPTAQFVASLGRNGPAFVVDVASDLALLWVERQLGGDDPLGDLARPLSALEQAIVARDWLPLVAVAFAEAWGALPPHLVPAPPDAVRRTLGPDETPVVVASVELDVAGGTTRMSLAYPVGTLRALLGAAAPAPPAATPPAEAPVDDLVVELRAELGRVRLAVSDLHALAVGDVIPLDRTPDAPAPVWIADRLRFDARPGMRGARLALEVLTLPHLPPTP